MLMRCMAMPWVSLVSELIGGRLEDEKGFSQVAETRCSLHPHRPRLILCRWRSASSTGTSSSTSATSCAGHAWAPTILSPSRWLGRGGFVAALPPHGSDVAGVRDAVLHHLDELQLPFRSAARSAMRLNRFKLAWLAWLVLLPRLTLQALSVARHGWRGESWAPTSEHAATRRLVELTGRTRQALMQTLSGWWANSGYLDTDLPIGRCLGLIRPGA